MVLDFVGLDVGVGVVVDEVDEVNLMFLGEVRWVGKVEVFVRFSWCLGVWRWWLWACCWFWGGGFDGGGWKGGGGCWMVWEGRVV